MRIKPRRIQFWKLGLGLLLVFGEIKTLLTPDGDIPSELRYTSTTQQYSGYAVSAAILVVGILLVVSGVRSAWPRPSGKADREP